MIYEKVRLVAEGVFYYEMRGIMKNYKQRAIEYFNSLINNKDVSICDRVLSNDYIDNDVLAGTPPGPKGTKEFVSLFLRLYPDMKINIEEAVSESNKVALRMVWMGTNIFTKEIMHKMGNIIIEFNDKGKICRRWSAYVNL